MEMDIDGNSSFTQNSQCVRTNYMGNVNISFSSLSWCHGRSIQQPVTFRGRSSSDRDRLGLQVTSPDLTSFTGMGSPWPSLSTSVPTPTSPTKMLFHQGGNTN